MTLVHINSGNLTVRLKYYIRELMAVNNKTGHFKSL